MIVNDKDAVARLNSPMNLINRLRSSTNNKRNSAMQLFGIGRQPLTAEVIKQEIEEVKVKFNPFIAKEQLVALVPTLNPQQVPALATQSEGLADILENHDAQIKLGLAHDNALKLLNTSVEMLSLKLEDVKADRLPQVIGAAGKIVESIRKERSEQMKNGKDREVHFHFYTPQQKLISDYEVIEVA